MESSPFTVLALVLLGMKLQNVIIALKQKNTGKAKVELLFFSLMALIFVGVTVFLKGF